MGFVVKYPHILCSSIPTLAFTENRCQCIVKAIEIRLECQYHVNVGIFRNTSITTIAYYHQFLM